MNCLQNFRFNFNKGYISQKKFSHRLNSRSYNTKSIYSWMIMTTSSSSQFSYKIFKQVIPSAFLLKFSKVHISRRKLSYREIFRCLWQPLESFNETIIFLTCSHLLEGKWDLLEQLQSCICNLPPHIFIIV